MNADKETKETAKFYAILLAASMLFFYFIFGIDGLMSTLGIALFLIVPCYLILNRFDFEEDEKLVFSFFMGVGVFPSIAYSLALVIPLKIAMSLTFVLLVAVSFAVGKFKKH